MKPIMSEMRTATIGALLVALGPVSMALYTPAMPTLVVAFQTSPASVKLTLTVFFFGFAFAQLVCGPLSDAYGRRPIAISFFSIYLVGSVVAMLAPDIGWLLAGRALQGVGVAAGTAISRAMVRDQFTGQSSARIMNLIGLMLAVGPALAPALGGLILSAADWHAIFVAMVAYGVVAVLLLWLAVPETNAAPDPMLARPASILRSYRTLLAHRAFMRSGLLLGLTIGGLFTLAALVPFVLMDGAGLTPTQFGLAMIAQTGAFTAGSALTGRLLRRIDAMRLIPVGLCIIGAAGLWYGIGLRLLPVTVVTVMIPAALWAFGVALVMPGATTGALAGFAAIAGAAAALSGFLQVGGGLAGSAVAALLFREPFLALTTVMPGMAILAAWAHVGLAPKSSRDAP